MNIQQFSEDDIIGVLHQTQQSLALCTSYQDTGEVFYGHERRICFETNFVRNHLFRFNWRDLGSDNFILYEGGHCSGYLFGEAKSFPSLESAVSSLTGITGGAAQVIPKLLLPTLVGGISVLELKDCHADYFPANRLASIIGRHSTSECTYTLDISLTSYVLTRVMRHYAEQPASIIYAGQMVCHQ
jgi:hypothetical protein